jgi:carbon starvation protein CstA
MGPERARWTVAILKALAAAVAFISFAVLLVRSTVIAVVLPRALWQLFRESGYPRWIQVLAALALLVGVTYLFRQGTFERSRRR